jgi:hypothetical protein
MFENVDSCWTSPHFCTKPYMFVAFKVKKTHRFVVSLGVSGISQQELVPFATSFRGVCHSCWRSCSECNEATWSVAWRFRCFPTCFGTLFDGFSMFFPNIVEDVAMLNITARGDYSVVNWSATLMMLPTWITGHDSPGHFVFTFSEGSQEGRRSYKQY